MADDRTLALIKETAISHLTLHSRQDRWLTGDEVEQLKKLDSYDLFLRVYNTMKDILDQRKSGQVSQDFDCFREADLRLWEHGHALMTFAIAEKLGWMENLQLSNSTY